jgi:hypothetical protein
VCQCLLMVGDYGFDANRDIAGIITNRWGHAYITPQPGFYFGKDGNPAPRDSRNQISDIACFAARSPSSQAVVHS